MMGPNEARTRGLGAMRGLLIVGLFYLAVLVAGVIVGLWVL
jgi:hypothetical protein